MAAPLDRMSGVELTLAQPNLASQPSARVAKSASQCSPQPRLVGRQFELDTLSASNPGCQAQAMSPCARADWRGDAGIPHPLFSA